MGSAIQRRIWSTSGSNIPKRSVKILDTEDHEETVTWKFDSDGMEGFTETLQTFQDLPEDLITYL